MWHAPRTWTDGERITSQVLNSELRDLVDAIKRLMQPIGLVKMTARAMPPANWLLCDGAAVSRTTYAALFQVIGTRYGAGNGTTTFNLPDLRGVIPRGKQSAQQLGATGGAETKTLQSANIPPHAHLTGDHYHSFTSVDVTGASSGAGGFASPANPVFATFSTPTRGTSGGSIAATGGNQPFDAMNPFLSVHFIIRAL